MLSSLRQQMVTNAWGFVRRKQIFSIQMVKFSLSIPSTKSDDSPKIVIPASVPGMMQAAILKADSESLVIENIELPKSPQSNEVLIDVQYCALNGPDVLMIKNSQNSNKKLSLPKILGYELAGKLVEVGDEAAKKGFKVGDKVIALNKDRYGGLAEKCIAEINDVWKIPSSVKTVDILCLLGNYVIALIGLEKKACLEEDEMVVINVGRGGIGMAAVDIAANVFRAQVIGVTVSEEKTTLVRDKGAFAALRYKDKKLVKKIEEFAAERDIKGVFEGVEGEKFKKMLDCFTSIYKDEYRDKMLQDNNFSVLVEHLSREGRLIIAGFALTKSDHSEDDSHECPFTITGFDLQEYKKKHPESYREAGNDILQYYEEGLIKSSYSLITGLYKINEAVKYLGDLKSSEKVIIDLKNRDAESIYKDT